MQIRHALTRALSVAALLTAAPAQAHWCNTLWISRYNLVVRPAQDTVDLSSGTATLDVYVQNNMGYPLKAFALSATASGGASVTSTVMTGSPRLANYLLPGESVKYTLTITGTGSLTTDHISFFVDNFGNNESYSYSDGVDGAGFVVKNQSGFAPSGGGAFDWTYNSEQSDERPGSQGMYLRASAAADWRTSGAIDGTAVDNLLNIYCSGRGSWSGTTSSTSLCPRQSSYTCPNPVNAFLTYTDSEHLWAIGELAARKARIGDAKVGYAAANARCGVADDDAHHVSKYFPMLALGYLGRDKAPWTSPVKSSVQVVLQGLTGTDDVGTAAKAAYYLTDGTSYAADVQNCLTGGFSAETKIMCAAARAIVLGPSATTDQEISTYVIGKVYWTNAANGFTNDTEGWKNITGFFASHVLALVAWDRRGYAANGGDTGSVSFYGAAPLDTVRPDAPGVRPPTPGQSLECTVTTGAAPKIRLSWPLVNTDVNGAAEVVSGYKLYRGSAPKPGTCTNPTGNCSNYTASTSTSASVRYVDFTSTTLTPGTTYYFAVTAIDADSTPPSLESDYSAEVSCVLPAATHPPVAVLSCDPVSGTAPLDVTCHCDASTDAGGDAHECLFTVAGGATDSVAFATGSWQHTFATPGSYTVSLVVVDAAGQSSPPSQPTTIEVASSDGNHPPVVNDITAIPNPVAVGSAVAFSASVMDDDAGQTLAYDWDFGDGSAHETSETLFHTYDAVGDYVVTLRVTDDGTPQAYSGTGVTTVSVVENHPPDLSLAYVDPVVVPPGGTVTFNGDGVEDPDGDTLSFDWDFGDGSAHGTDPTTTHTYGNTVGSYTATLTVVDDGLPPMSATREFTVDVTTNRPPNIDNARVDPSTGPASLVVNFSCDGCGDPDGQSVVYLWTVNLASHASDSLVGQQASYTFSETGEHHIILAATDDDPTTPLQVTKSFVVTVQPGAGVAPAAMVAVCGCADASRAEASLLTAGLVIVLWRRRLRGPCA
jgi:PKD repeat protein